MFSVSAVLNVQGSLRGFDVAVLTALTNGRHNEIAVASHSKVMRAVPSLGGTALVALVTTVTVLSLLMQGQKIKVAFMALKVTTNSVLNNTLKQLFDLPRPDIFPMAWM